MLLGDPPILVTVAAWAALCAAILLVEGFFFDVVLSEGEVRHARRATSTHEAAATWSPTTEISAAAAALDPVEAAIDPPASPTGDQLDEQGEVVEAGVPLRDQVLL